jgi:hypothetical protein
MMAASDQDILTALGGIIEMQRTARSDVELCAETGLVFLRVYYQKLPESVARRLTELDPVALAAIPGATGHNGSEKARKNIISSVASNAAFAQVIRAANIYRKKLGLGLLEADGRLAQTEGQLHVAGCGVIQGPTS